MLPLETNSCEVDYAYDIHLFANDEF